MTVLAAEAAAPVAESVVGGTAAAGAAAGASDAGAGAAKYSANRTGNGSLVSPQAVRDRKKSAESQGREIAEKAEKSNPVRGASKRLPQTGKSPLAGSARRNVRVFNVPKTSFGGSSPAGYSRTLKTAFLVLFLFLIAREVLSPGNKPRGGQILAVMLAFLILAFIGETKRAGKVAALLGLLVMTAALLSKDSMDFIKQIQAFVTSIGSAQSATT